VGEIIWVQEAEVELDDVRHIHKYLPDWSQRYYAFKEAIKAKVILGFTAFVASYSGLSIGSSATG
jgi:hypothetical protein